MRLLFNLAFVTVLTSVGYSQDSILHRVILIGESNAAKTIQAHASGNMAGGKTSVIFLDENSYLRGKMKPGSKDEMAAHQLLKSQFRQMRDKGAVVYLVPGNHTWNKQGAEGLEKIKRQQQFLEKQGDSLVKFLAGTSCPDPVAIDLTDSSMIIFFNSKLRQ